MKWLRSGSLLTILMSASIAMLGIGRALVSCAELEDMSSGKLQEETPVIQREHQQDLEEERHAEAEKGMRERNDIHISKLKSNYSKDDLDLLGVSVHHLQHYFMKDVRNAGFTEQSKIYEIVDLRKLDENDIVREKGANLACPMDGKKGASYVHSIVFDEDANEKDEDHYGKATVMLSYTWGYSIGDIVTTLADYCRLFGLDPKRTYVWICCLCVNQHRFVEKKTLGESVPFDTLEDIFGRRVKGIGHLLPMMNPWYDPGYLGRVWCLFEMIMAKKYGCKITMIMPEHDRLDFLKMFDDENKSHMDTMTRLFEVLSNTRVQDAQASEESDRVNIMKIIESMPGSYTAFNVQVNELVRGWAVGIIKDEVDVRRNLVNTSVDLSQDDFAHFLTAVGGVLDDIGEKRDALQMHRESVSIFESLYGKNHVNTAVSMNNMALAMSDLGQKQEALDLYQETLAIQESVYGRQHASTANIMNGMALVMSDLGQKKEALDLYQETLAIYESLYGRQHETTASTIHNMANLMSDLGQKEEAFDLYQETLAVFESVYGREHASTASTMHSIARVMEDLGQKKEALDLYQETLAIKESLYGRQHADTANTLNNIANVMSDLGQNKEALDLYQETLGIKESVYGREHASTANTMNGMALVLSDLGQNKEALDLHQEALAIYESLYGRNHADTANTMGKMAFALLYLDNIEESLGMFKESLSVYETIFGPEHEQSTKVRDLITTITEVLIKEALDLYQETLAIKESQYGRKHADTASTMYNIANLMKDLGQKKEALDLYQETLEVYESLYGRKHADTAKTMMKIAVVMDDLGQKKEALDLYQETLEVYESLYGREHTDTAKTMKNMAITLYYLDHKEESLGMFKEVLSVYETIFGPEHEQSINLQNAIAVLTEELGNNEL